MLLTSRRPVLATKLKRCDVTLPPGGAGAEPPLLMTLNKPWYFSLKKPRIWYFLSYYLVFLKAFIWQLW